MKKQFFTAKDGMPKILFLLPVLCWILGGSAYALVNINKGAVQKKIQAASMAVGLQQDINFISTKTKASEVFELSKKEMIKEEKNQNFLMRKVKKKLDKSVFAESMGKNDENLLGFSADLSPTLTEDLPDSLIQSNSGNLTGVGVAEVDSITATDDINYLMNKIKVDQQSKYHRIEAERKQRLADAKLANRRNRESLEHSSLSVEAAAYQKGLADSQARYGAFHGTTSKGGNANAQRRTNKKRSLTFNTATGIKDELNLNVKKVPINNKIEADLSPIDPILQQQAIKAVIDQKQKFRSGDKIQLRVLEMGIYQNQSIPANTLLYGICSISRNRLFIKVASIQLNGQRIPAALAVYDLDGMPGIYIDGAYQDMTKDAINQGLADVGNLGIRNPISNLSIRLGRKANQKQTAAVPAGYEVLLYDAQNF